jgi:hypothetical protein
MAEGGIGTENVFAVEKINKSYTAEKPIAVSSQRKEAGAEQQRFTIPIVDTRETPFPDQTEVLQKRLAEDKTLF